MPRPHGEAPKSERWKGRYPEMTLDAPRFNLVGPIEIDEVNRSNFRDVEDHRKCGKNGTKHK